MKNGNLLAFIGCIVGAAFTLISMIVTIIVISASWGFRVSAFDIILPILWIGAFVVLLIHFLDKKEQKNYLLPVIGTGCGALAAFITFINYAIAGPNALWWLYVINALLGMGCLVTHYVGKMIKLQSPIFELLGLIGIAVFAFGSLFYFIAACTSGFLIVGNLIGALGFMAAAGLMLPSYLSCLKAMNKK